MDSLQSITVNPTELCNRTCKFCPRVNPDVYPNRSLHISDETVDNLSNKLSDIKYSNRLGWSGNGEPLLTRSFLKKVRKISNKNPQIKVHELITNGDLLDETVIKEIYDSGINHIIVSVYDGEGSINRFLKLFSTYDKSAYSLRPTFGDDLDGFTNRSGTVDVNNHSDFRLNKCYFPLYKLIIDWDGSVLICCEDWGRKSKSALNINDQSIEEIWLSDTLYSYRDKLVVGDRSLSPCNLCNVNGEKIGEQYVKSHY